MNRPIKFRGMSLYNGVWAYGNLKKEFDKVYITSTQPLRRDSRKAAH